MEAGDAGKAEQLALAIARGEGVATAAKALGLPERTAYRWAARPKFKRRVEALRRRMIDATVGRLAREATAAVTTLAGLLKARDKPSVQLAAARAILDNLMAVRSHAELSERVAELEKRVDGQREPRW